MTNWNDFDWGYEYALDEIEKWAKDKEGEYISSTDIEFKISTMRQKP